MRINWDKGFERVRWAFLGVSWALFVIAHIGMGAGAAKWGENMVYMLFFTGGSVVFARLSIWIVRGFIGSSEISR